MFIRPTVFRVLLVLCSVMFIAEVVTSVSVSSPGDDLSNSSSSSSSSIIRSTLLDDIALESRYVDDEWFYQLAKYGSNLERELSTDNGPFTIFLPSAEALSDLEDNTFPRSCLYTDCDYYNGDQCDEFVSTDLLTSILLYHIVQGEAILPSDLVDGQMISTMNGENVTIGVNGTFEIDFVNGTIAIDGLPVKSAMPFPTVRGNILYYLDTALLPRSIADQKSEIIATCDVPYYLDPLVEDTIMAGNDSIRILLAWLIPSIVLTLIGCCYYFCCWGRKKDPDDPSSLAANREDSKETDANNNNNAVNHANLEDKREVDEPETLSAEAIPPSS